MKRLIVSLALSCLAVVAACGGGGGGGTPVAPIIGPGPTPVQASFSTEQSNPGSLSVAMAPATTNASAVGVAVTVTGTSGVYGAGFDLLYDASKVSYLGYTAGNLLEQGGNAPNYTIHSPQAGLVVVGASRTGSVSGVNVTSTRTLVILNFQVNDKGDFPSSFRNMYLLDSSVNSIPGLTWYAGSFKGL